MTHGYTNSPMRICHHTHSGKLWMMDLQLQLPNSRIRSLHNLLVIKKLMVRFRNSFQIIPLVLMSIRRSIRSIIRNIIRPLLSPSISTNIEPTLRILLIEEWMRKSGLLLGKLLLVLMVKKDRTLLQTTMVD